MSVTVTARLSEQTAEKLELLAQHTRRSKSFLIAEAIGQYVKYELKFVEAVLEGIASADRGELISSEEMTRRTAKRIAKYRKRAAALEAAE